MEATAFLEWAAVLFNLTYVLLAVKEKNACWPFGIIGSALSIWFFYAIGLYAEAILFLFYVFVGFYGWISWSKKRSERYLLRIISLHRNEHIILAIVGSILALALGYVLDEHTQAQSAYFDAFTTVFSFIATWLTARKILENWIYWIVIDLLTIGLYASKGAFVYAALSLIYTAMAIYGFQEWKKRKALLEADH